MGSAKDIILRPISHNLADTVIRQLHYSGKVVQNSQLHIGVYYQGKIEGAMQFGPSLDKRKIRRLVEGTPWNGFLELNRMAFSDKLPRNSESRALGIALRLIRKHLPAIQWVISFADGAQCGDGTIYRASGFVLTGIMQSANLVRRGDGVVIHKMTLESSPTQARPELGGRSYYDITGGTYNLQLYARITNGKTIPGYQLRYIFFLDPTARSRLTVPILPFGEIARRGAGMYRGKPRVASIDGDASGDQPEEGGSTPTATLQHAAQDEI